MCYNGDKASRHVSKRHVSKRHVCYNKDRETCVLQQRSRDMCVTTETWHLDRLGQLGEFEQSRKRDMCADGAAERKWACACRDTRDLFKDVQDAYGPGITFEAAGAAIQGIYQALCQHVHGVQSAELLGENGGVIVVPQRLPEPQRTLLRCVLQHHNHPTDAAV